jgi:integrase
MYLAQHDVEHVTIVKCPKTEASRRAVPLQTIALEALERQPANRQGGLVFPAERGGYLDLHNTSTSWARLSDLASRRSRRSRSSSRSTPPPHPAPTRTPRCTRFESRPPSR